MAESKHSFLEVRGKVVDSVELNVESDYHGLTIWFQDRTALTFALEPCVFTFPTLEDWASGEAKEIKSYEAVRSSVPRL